MLSAAACFRSTRFQFVLDGDHKVGVRIVRLHLEEVRELVGDERRGRLESRVVEPLDRERRDMERVVAQTSV